MRILRQSYQSVADTYWLAFLLTGHREMSVEIVLRALKFDGGISRRDVIANALAVIREDLAVSAALTKWQEGDDSPVAPPNWSLDPATTKMQLERALLAIDLFPRCALLLKVFEGMKPEEVSTFLDSDGELVAKGWVTGLLALTRNLAGTQSKAMFATSDVVIGRGSPEALRGPRKHVTTTIPSCVLGFLLLTLCLCACTRQERDPRTQPQLVRLIRVEFAPGAGRAYTGIVVARVQSDLGFRVAGKITKRLVDVGQTVHGGQLLMSIDVTDFTNTITTEGADIEAAKARADSAVADEARYRGLVSSGAVSASAYDQVKATADSALARLSAAEAQVQIAKDQAAYTDLLADADGVVVQTLAEPGQVVSTGQPVVKLAHSGPREAAIDLPETVRPALGSIVKANLYGNDAPGVLARLRQLSDSSDPLTRTFEARYVLQGSAASAPLGATVSVWIPRPNVSDSLEVPVASITDRGSGPGVWVLNRRSATVGFRSVKIASIGNEVATVTSGLNPGEEIVALGSHLLNNEERVRFDGEKGPSQ